MDSDTEPDAKQLLLRRFRCVAFAALAEGVTEGELLAALDVAVIADGRRVDPAPPARRLRAVPAGD
jgi:hypothetical protein